ncbi:chemotaxis protein CheW [Reichenbachiella sp.]|uniref:chemotaxis protein CheW n=1 Tax=Reichenbachiella sp. TaxID=2184521 RepID=UPI00329A5EF9
MALGKNIKPGKKEPSKKKGTKTIKKADPIAKETEPIAEELSKPVVSEPEPIKPAIENPIQSLNKLNHDLEKDQQIEEHSKMLVVFPVGNEEYAFEIAQIKEVVPVPPISSLPQTKSYVKGVANVRGNVLAVIDLARKFGLQKTLNDDYTNYVIVIKSEEVKVAVASNQVPETLMIKDSQIDNTADIMRKSGNEQNFIKGIIKKDSRMIIFIDVLEMVENEQAVNA